MADSIEEKWPRSLVGCIIFFFVLVLLIATMIPNNLIDRSMEKERAMAERLLPTLELQRVVDRTNGLYIAAIIDSGLKRGISDMLMPRGPTTVDAFEEKASWWFTYLANRGEALQKVVYQLFFRLVLMSYWLPFFAVIALPSIIAGYMRWNAKRYGFDYSSPFINNNAINLISWSGVILLVAIFFPGPLPPLVVSTIIVVLMPPVISLLISNLPKRI